MPIESIKTNKETDYTEIKMTLSNSATLLNVLCDTGAKISVIQEKTALGLGFHLLPVEQ